MLLLWHKVGCVLHCPSGLWSGSDGGGWGWGGMRDGEETMYIKNDFQANTCSSRKAAEALLSPGSLKPTMSRRLTSGGAQQRAEGG